MASAEQQDIQPGSQVKFIRECIRYRGEYIGDNENGMAKVQTNKRGVVLVDKAILRPDEKGNQNAASITQ